ncbi:MAG: PfkB family carbohydrate kinase [archaeon]
MLEKIVDKFSETRILVIGDVILDKYIFGDASRLSPEAPVPVVNITGEKYVLGGAANVAANVASLGGKVYLCGVVGDDYESSVFVDIASSLGINSHLYKSKDFPTILKTRVLANNHQLVRLDREKKVEFDRYTFQRLSEKINSLIDSVDLVILSDYNKGVLADYLFSRDLVRKIKRNYHKPVLVDPKPVNIGNFFYADCIAPNLKEAEEIFLILKGYAAGPKLNKKDNYLPRLSRYIMNNSHSKSVAITCGDDGIFACAREINNGKRVCVHASLPAKAREVYDVSGAGDTALAVMGMAWASGANLFEACELANAASGVVVGKIGTATLTRKELKANLKK